MKTCIVILLLSISASFAQAPLAELHSSVATALGFNLPGAVSTTSHNEVMGAGAHRVVNRNVKTLTGIDVLEEEGFAELKGKRIGLLTNQTGFDRAGRRDVDEMLAAGVQVVRLFSPEHGFSVSQDTENIPDTKDSTTGLPIVSLYEPGKRRLTAEQMRNLDAVVFDVKDVGSRFWTYSCTLLYAVEESGKAKKPFFVLDRPNPITGTHVEGPMLDSDLHSFTGCYEMPLRHGMTFGELATMANAEQHWGADLRVIKLKNWERGDWFDATTLTWVNPSPNMRSLNAALLYPGVGMIEFATNYSVGRGTDAPFEQIGADWIDGPTLAQLLNSRFIPGVRVYPTRFRPSSSNLKNVDVSGVRFVITDRDAFDSTRLGIELAAALQKLFPGKIDFEKCRLLIGNHAVLDELKNGTDAGAIWSKAQEQASQFAERRKPYLLY